MPVYKPIVSRALGDIPRELPLHGGKARVVIDSCIYIRCCEDAKSDSRGFVLEATRRWDVFASDYILREVRDALMHKWLGRIQYVDPAMAELRRGLARVVAPSLVVMDACPDSCDNPILGTALAAGADAIFSHDGDLLDMGSFRGVRIYHPRAVRLFEIDLVQRAAAHSRELERQAQLARLAQEAAARIAPAKIPVPAWALV